MTIYATGVGVFSPPLTDGEIVPLEPPFPTAPGIAEVLIEARFDLLIETRPAQITYAGAAPGLVAGMAQINFIVPLDTPAGTSYLNVRTSEGALSLQVLLEVGP